MFTLKSINFLFLKSPLFTILYARLIASEKLSWGNLIKTLSTVNISHLLEGKKYRVLNSVKINLELSIFFLKIKKSLELNSPNIYGNTSAIFFFQ